jgi:hypothetical protein
LKCRIPDIVKDCGSTRKGHWVTELDDTDEKEQWCKVDQGRWS